MRRRQRQIDPLANPATIESILAELRERFPSLPRLSARNQRKLFQALRHQESYSATETKRGRPAAFDRELLGQLRSHLAAILSREAGDRISIQTFIGHYLPMLDWPEDIRASLTRNEINRFEAAQLARLSADRLGIKPKAAARLRQELMQNHVRMKGSQSTLREKVREALGEVTAVSTEKMTAAVDRVDELLRVDPEDRRHLFYEQMKDFFFALRDIEPEEIDDAVLDLLTRRADDLMEVVHSIRRKRRAKEKSQPRFSI